MATWIDRWRDIIATEPEMPGVWRRREGGFHVRGRITDPRTGKRREINAQLPDVTKAREAYAWLQTELDKLRTAGPIAQAVIVPRFRSYAATVLERKIDLGKMRSASTRAKWGWAFEHHLFPAFGEIYVDQLTHADVKAWQSKIAAKVRAGDCSPATANTVLGVLRQVVNEAVEEYDLKDPMRGIDAFDTREHATYTEEEPNSLAPADVPRFLATMRELFPKHYAFVLLGFATGLRPSSLRPLRREGASADIKWDQSILLVRRSHTKKQEVMETTKTNAHQRLHLPEELISVLRWHAKRLGTKGAKSELLFPNVRGGLRSTSCLDKPFERVSKAISLPYRFTPRGMRRTFQDLARAAEVGGLVTRSISGHATTKMQEHYSTVRDGEQREAMAKIIDIATARPKATKAARSRRQAA